MQPAHNNRFTVGRYFQALVLGKGSTTGAVAFCESQPWLDRGAVINALKGAVGALGTSGGALAANAVTDVFLAALRAYSVPGRLLPNLRQVPLNTRIFSAASGVAAGEVVAGASIPVLKGSWASTVLEPRKFAGIVVRTNELMQSLSPVAAAALTDDLSAATGEAEDLAFCSPWVAGSVLYGTANFTDSGNTASAIAYDLFRLTTFVPGCYRPGAAWLMAPQTAAWIGSRHASGDTAASFPGVGPQGGSLLGIPILTTPAMEQTGSPVVRAIGLVSPQDIHYADGGVDLSVSSEAALQMLDNPTMDSLAATPGEIVSLFQTGAIALKAVREASWLARVGAGAYFTTDY